MREGKKEGRKGVRQGTREGGISLLKASLFLYFLILIFKTSLLNSDLGKLNINKNYFGNVNWEIDLKTLILPLCF
jgi:hypothetical protein